MEKLQIIVHHARIVTYADEEKKKCVSLLTNDFDMSPEDIIAIYKQRWEIETLFKQIKQNFPLHFFYGESANAIKIQIWVTLIANLLLTMRTAIIKDMKNGHRPYRQHPLIISLGFTV